MGIKLIAADMDGTFLSDTGNYDRERFGKQYAKMKEKGIRFVVASGNQYYQLCSFFEGIVDELTFVAENGAYIVSEGKELFAAEIPRKETEEIIDIISKMPAVNMVVCGKKSAYVKQETSGEFFKYANRYYHKLQRSTNIKSVDDQIFKFALNCPVEMVKEVLNELNRAVGHILTPTASGHGDIDLILPGINKAHGLKILQEKWDITENEILAFGDSGNDLEMLAHAYYSYAMENGNEEVKKTARFTAPSNNKNGVLEIIDKYL
jgi:Cof subfamily protein (haloacid dehalogenase superfamily)